MCSAPRRCYPRFVGPFSFWEILIILGVLLLLFGAKRLPEMGRSLGRGMREFKDAVTGVTDVKDEIEPAKTEPRPAEPEVRTTGPTPPPSQPSESERVSR
jgi:sec-independent protein translocase protein TatA